MAEPTGPLLGFNTNGLQNHRLDEALRLLADEGYEAVALTPDTCHLDPLCCRPREVEALGALLAGLAGGAVLSYAFLLAAAFGFAAMMIALALRRTA